MAWGAYDRTVDPNFDAGTVGDLFVDPVNGNDANPGTEAQPFKTLNKANSVVVAGQTVKLRGGKYREQLTPKSGTAGLPIKWERYGTEKPIITGADPLTGFVSCTSATDQPRIGSNWSNCKVVRNLPKTTFVQDDPHSANVFVNGVRSLPCLSWEGADRGDKFYQGWYHDHWLADGIQTNDGNETGVSLIEAYIDASVVAAYTPAQIQNCLLIGTMYPNVQFRTTIASVDVANNKIVLDQNLTPNFKYAGAGNAGAKRYALTNMLPDIEAGQWGFWDNGDGTCDFYLWPANPGDENNVEISVRPYCVNAYNKDYLEFRGIEFRQSTGSAQGRDSNDGYGLGSAINHTYTGMNYHFHMEHCRVTGTYGTNKTFSVRISGITDCQIRHCEFSDGMEHSGPFFSGLSTGAHIKDSIIERCTLDKIAGSPVEIYSADHLVMAHCLIKDCGLVAHANKMNWYEDSHNMLFFGNEYVNTNGYVTDQEATDSFVIGNLIPADFYSANNARAYTTQGHNTGPQTAQVRNSLFFNNTCPPHKDSLAATNGVTLGATLVSTPISNADIYWENYNCLIHGDASPASQVTAKDYVWDTASNAATNLNNKAIALNDVYVDAANGDFSIKTGAALRAATGRNMQTEIDSLKPLFPLFNGWNLDYAGDPINWAAPPIGAKVFTPAGTATQIDAVFTLRTTV